MSLSPRDLSKDWQQAAQAAAAAGCRITRAGNKHYLWWPPGGGRPVTVASTPSDPRSRLNSLADLRRAGLRLPPRRPAPKRKRRPRTSSREGTTSHAA